MLSKKSQDSSGNTLKDSFVGSCVDEKLGDVVDEWNDLQKEINAFINMWKYNVNIETFIPDMGIKYTQHKMIF